ncbi:protein phosphatase 1 regulatory subunit 12B isoform X8 [Hemibagrus wyckioides]|uniref:protein phosphatase 1 regulatory subunit 12B isoform X8 n=1 Tax=Hemibagrus wyckioides TaxID=337641 RepID=UPI00266BB395|nr:protein phosphatase 1 regulatory subunit 12B isoform X8 [Hemibagrus wyckioides]
MLDSSDREICHLTCGTKTCLLVPENQFWSRQPSLHSLATEASKGDASEVESASETLGNTSYYTRRELDSLNKTTDFASKDYKKLYEEALAENEKLKACLEDSKQDLAKLRLQLDKITQKQDRISERSSVSESEKMEKQLLEKRVTEMEEDIKVLTELKSDNQRLKDENGALIRVISKLSK